MKPLLLVAAGGALGSMLRWAVSLWLARPAGTAGFPWATLAVNLVGSAAIGFALTWLSDRGGGAASLRVFLAPGLLGGFTTFSAFSWETLALARDGQLLVAAGYAIASLAGGLVAAMLGSGLAARF